MDDDRRDLDDAMEIINGIDKEDSSTEDNTYVYSDYHEHKKDKKPKRKKILSYLAVALVASLITGIASPFLVLNYMEKEGLLTGQEASPNITIENSDNANAITVAAHNAMNSVVGITTVSVQQFGFLQQEVDGVGSGVIVNSNGYILTNSHVVSNGNAKDIKVLFENGDEKKGEVLWSDPLLDLAVVKVDATNLPVAKLGDSDELLIGETVIAIGNPLGLEFQSTVTSGIISGLHRSINADGNIIEDLIQTDASINPGNSGGPLLNNKGEVIGINTAKIRNGEGLGFAIPINSVKPVIEQIIESGTYQTVLMGITGVDVELYERQLGVDLSADKGAIIIEVAANSPADKAGLIAGDVITKIDDTEIDGMSQLKKTLYNYKKGDKAKLSILRNGNEKNINIEFSQVK